MVNCCQCVDLQRPNIAEKFGRQRQRPVRFSVIFLCALLCGCAHLVRISYPPEALIHPAFGQQFTTWDGEVVEVALTPSLRGESLKYLAKYDQVFLANSIRERGLHHEYKIAGKGIPLIVYAKNPGVTLKEKHYPTSGIVLGLTAVKEWRPGQMPILKLYDAFDPAVVKSSHGPHPIAANYTATLAVLYSHARKVAESAAASFLRPDNPRFVTGIYLIHQGTSASSGTRLSVPRFLPRLAQTPAKGSPKDTLFGR